MSSILTDQEIHDADPAPHERFDQERIDFARAIEQAVLRKLATVSVVPDLVDMAKDSHGHCIICGVSPSKIIEALAAARVQALEEAAKRMEGPDNNYGAVIRALIGGQDD